MLRVKSTDRRGGSPAAPMVPPAYAPVAHSFRDEIIDHAELFGVDLSSAAGRRTLDTNSTLAPARGRSLLRLLARRGAPSIAGRRVLDLGAGFGSMSLYFAILGAEVVAVDLKAERLELAARVAQRHQLVFRGVVADASALPLPDGAFDLVVANNSLCYVVDRAARQQAFAEIARVSRSTGWFVMRNPNRLHPRDQFTGLPMLPLLSPAAAVRTAARYGHARSLVRLDFPTTAVRELRRAGFREVRWEPVARSRLVARTARYVHIVAQTPVTREDVQSVGHNGTF